MARLLTLLATAYKTVADSARLWGLGGGVYPLLADLSRQGLVEHRWAAVGEETRLVYKHGWSGLLGCAK